MSYGSDSEFVSRTLLTSNVLLDHTYLREGIDRDESMTRIFAMVSRFAHMSDLISEYLARESAAVEALTKSHERMARERAFSIPEISNLDTLCMSFFIQAKHALQDLLDLATCFYGGRLAKGYFSNLEDLLKEKHDERDTFYLFLRETAFLREFVRSVRNCIEHPKPDARVIFSNLRLNENASIDLPTFQMIHGKYPMEKVALSLLLEKMFSNLVEFAEVFVAHVVERNIKSEFAGCPVLLLHHDDGVHGNKNVHYGYGIKMNGEVMPIG
jgi:hypothetical protein